MQLTLWMVCLAAAAGCAGAQALTAPDAPTARWERRVGKSYENKGVARIERLANRWVLTVFCDGTHSTYLDPSGKFDATRDADRFVHVRYRYVEHSVDVQCVRAPCAPVLERRIVLERVKRLAVTRPEAEARAQHCEPARPGKG